MDDEWIKGAWEWQLFKVVYKVVVDGNLHRSNTFLKVIIVQYTDLICFEWFTSRKTTSLNSNLPSTAEALSMTIRELVWRGGFTRLGNWKIYLILLIFKNIYILKIDLKVFLKTYVRKHDSTHFLWNICWRICYFHVEFLIHDKNKFLRSKLNEWER